VKGRKGGKEKKILSVSILMYIWHNEYIVAFLPAAIPAPVRRRLRERTCAAHFSLRTTCHYALLPAPHTAGTLPVRARARGGGEEPAFTAVKRHCCCLLYYAGRNTDR